MKFWFIRFLCFLSLPCFPSSHKYPLTICAIFKNEAPWLKEWVTYHHNVLKVDRFYLYNNDSTDQFAEVLQPFIDQGIVELIDWSSSDPRHGAVGGIMDAPWSAAQLGAYNDCLKNRALGKAKWVAMIDIDEFIMPAKGVGAFYKLLHSAKKEGIGTIQLYWRVFGTSNVEALEPGELLIEKLVWRSRDEHPINRHFKSIHQPEAIKFCLVHEAGKMKKEYKRKRVTFDQGCIHHYWTRTEQVCFEKRKLSKFSNPDFFEEFHQVKDESMMRYLQTYKNGR